MKIKKITLFASTTNRVFLQIVLPMFPDYPDGYDHIREFM